MKDINGADLSIGDYVAFDIDEGGKDIGEIIEAVTPDSPADPEQLRVLCVGTNEASHNSGLAGIVRFIEGKIHVHFAMTRILATDDCELVMQKGGKLVGAVDKVAAAPVIAAGGATLEVPAAPAPTPSPATPEAPAPVAVVEEPGTDANGSPVPAAPHPAG